MIPSIGGGMGSFSEGSVGTVENDGSDLVSVANVTFFAEDVGNELEVLGDWSIGKGAGNWKL